MTLTHLDEQGRARMVDVSEKADSERIAIAKGEITMQPETLALIRSGGLEKGDVLVVARVAGIMAAKKTSELIPLCHPLMLTNVKLEFDVDAETSKREDEYTSKQVNRDDVEREDKSAKIEITATVKTTGRTGVEMEALTAVTVAALTIYDMAKAVDRAMRVQNVRLVRKSGGKSGDVVLE